MLKKIWAVAVIALVVLGAWVIFVLTGEYRANKVQALTREGVITQIQNLSQLTTVSFNVDTVVISQKEGTWYKLWQDEQKGLFVVKGKVTAGIDLAKLDPNNVQVTMPANADDKQVVSITLPKPEVFLVAIDDVQMYDWKTGVFGIMPSDPQILAKAQESAKTEILQKACQGDILTIANDNAKRQIQTLFALTGAQVAVAEQAGVCP